MAKHRRRRHHRRYGSIVSVPGLSALDVMKHSVQPMDVIVGVGAGVLASGFLQMVLKKIMPATMWDQFKSTVGNFVPAVMGIGAGAALYYAQKKSSRGAGHAIGAASAGLAVAAYSFAKTSLPATMFDFSAVTQVNMGNYARQLGNYQGLLISDGSDMGAGVAGMGGRAMGGLLVSDHSDGLNELAALSMSPDDDGIADLMGM